MNQKKGHFWNGKGFYLALTLVIAGAAMASFLAIDSMMTKLQPESTAPQTHIDGEETTPWDGKSTPTEKKQEDVPVTSSSSAQPSASSSSSNSASSQEQPQPSATEQPASAEQPVPQGPRYISPMNGQVLQAFSGDELVYNQTLEDWRTHNGLDLQGLQNDNVASPMKATVVKVDKDDPLWGGLVELQGEDGIIVRLCGLDSVYVQKGQALEQGAAVGLLGTIPCEGALERHLHVECLQDEKYVDPAPLLGIDG